MKLVFCLGSLDKGGTQRVVSNLSNYFAKKNQVSILTTKKDSIQYQFDSSIKLYHLDKKKNQKSNNFIRVIRLIKFIKKENPDVVLTFQPEPSFRMIIANIVLKKKIILSVRNDPNIEYSSFKRKVFMKLLYPKVNLMVLQTKDAMDYFKKSIKNSRMVVIPNPINDDFVSYKTYTGIRNKTIVNVGRLELQKNQEFLIESFSVICKKFPDYKLLIYGDGSLKKHLQNKIDELQLNDNVILMGQVDDIADNIRKAGIFVLSSDYEGMPNALMEAMALGLPCISTDCPCGGPKFLIKNGENGLLVGVNNKREMIDAIDYLISNKKQAKLLGLEAKKIRDDLNPNRINNLWEDSIMRLLE